MAGTEAETVVPCHFFALGKCRVIILYTCEAGIYAPAFIIENTKVWKH